jgi:hypothetical protein
MLLFCFMRVLRPILLNVQGLCHVDLFPTSEGYQEAIMTIVRVGCFQGCSGRLQSPYEDSRRSKWLLASQGDGAAGVTRTAILISKYIILKIKDNALHRILALKPTPSHGVVA